MNVAPTVANSTRATDGAAPRELTPEEFAELAAKIEDALAHVIVGQTQVIRATLITLLAGGNALLEGVPGLGKTLLVRTLSQVLDASFSRIQFTPDLMPADIVGTNVISEDEAGRRVFHFEPGPVFAHLVLADEINRATPKTQSALLEAMQERSVTVGKTTHQLPSPFFVLATQNPLEMEGTYPLPEAQLDRFLFKLRVPYPSDEDLLAISDRTTGAVTATAPRVATVDDIAAMQAFARGVPCAAHVTRHAVRLVRLTHPDHPEAPESVERFVAWGASPRAVQGLVLAGKIASLFDGRFNVSAGDLEAAAADVLRHRLVLNFEAQAERIDPDDIVADVVEAARHIWESEARAA